MQSDAERDKDDEKDLSDVSCILILKLLDRRK
jgi:hypothetical protein